MSRFLAFLAFGIACAGLPTVSGINFSCNIRLQREDGAVDPTRLENTARLDETEPYTDLHWIATECTTGEELRSPKLDNQVTGWLRKGSFEQETIRAAQKADELHETVRRSIQRVSFSCSYQTSTGCVFRSCPHLSFILMDSCVVCDRTSWFVTKSGRTQ